jgi:putative methionine-R-sulfoxide reductase with GAF domain
MVTDQGHKPVLDQQTFDKLLEAGYVLQEHSRRMRELEERMESHNERLREQESADQIPVKKSKTEAEANSRSNSDYTLTLAEIVEAQRQIQARHLELDKAMAVVAEKVAHITGATGAAIGILDEKTVRYRAGAGAPALPAGSAVPLAHAICAASVRTGQVIRSEDVNTEVLFDPEPCRERGILSLIVVPIYQEGSIVGGLELYFDRIRGYAEQDIHTCQLMAGLVTESLGRDADLRLKKSMAAERSTMLAAIERLQPNLVAWAEDQSSSEAVTSSDHSAASAERSSCWKCGSKVLAVEQFCGKCGAPKASDGGPSSMQSKLASAWHMQQTGKQPLAAPAAGEIARPVALQQQHDANLEEQDGEAALPEPFSLPELDALVSQESQLEQKNVEAPSTEPVRPQQDAVVWSSAARARDFLESLAATHTPSAVARFWRSRRGDFYLAIAVILVAVVIRWGIWSNHSVGATSRGAAVSASSNPHKPPAPDSDLSTFDKLLVSIGLAEPPETPEYKGNPETQVWVDVHTALYYCPGSDLYGKTPDGKFTSQRDAQLDQFESASRKVCD